MLFKPFFVFFISSVLIISSFAGTVLGAENFPTFPMSFWGVAFINNSPAPKGTIIRAYYGDTLAGETVVQDNGIYGYTEPTKQKLVVGSGEGVIIFTIQSPNINGGQETKGSNIQSYEKFESGVSVNKDFYFTILAPTTTTIPPASVGGGGGGGGYIPPTTTTTTTTTTKPQGEVKGATTENLTPEEKQQLLNQLIQQLQFLLTQLVKLGGTMPPGLEKYLAGISQIQTDKVSEIKRDLYLGLEGDDVKLLQNFLINQKKGPKAIILSSYGPTGYFGPVTQSALAEYQASVGIKPAIGYFGPITRNYLKSIGY